MTDGDKAYVKEVVRIIKEKSQTYKLSFFDCKTLILVSHRFFKLAKEWLRELEKNTFGRTPIEDDNLCVHGMLAARARWLRDYEFEIRPKCEHMITENSK